MSLLHLILPLVADTARCVFDLAGMWLAIWIVYQTMMGYDVSIVLSTRRNVPVRKERE